MNMLLLVVVHKYDENIVGLVSAGNWDIVTTGSKTWEGKQII